MPLNHTSQHSELTEDQYAALGKAVVEWANIEELLGAVVGRLLATPDFLARSFTDAMSAVRVQTVLTQAIEIHRVRYQCRLVRENFLDELTAINAKVTALRTTRNRIAHFCWMRTNDDELWGTNFSGGMPSPKKEKHGYTTLTMTDLSALHDKSYTVVEQLLSILEQLPKVKEETLLTSPIAGP